MGTEDRNITSEVEAVLEQYVRPALSAHGGDMEVAGVEGGVVFFRLTGRCAGCAAADQTSEDLINRELIERVPGIKKAVLVNGISPELLEQTLALLREHPSFCRRMPSRKIDVGNSVWAPFCYSLNCKIFEETGNTEYNGKQ